MIGIKNFYNRRDSPPFVRRAFSFCFVGPHPPAAFQRAHKVGGGRMMGLMSNYVARTLLGDCLSLAAIASATPSALAV